MTKKFFLYAIAALGALQSAAAQPRLIVQIVVGSMRGEDLDRYAENFGEGGFRRLTEGGTVYADSRYDYLQTTTPVSLATLTTGAMPSTHGVIGSRWVDYTTNRTVELTAGRKGPGAYHLIAPTLAETLLRHAPGSRAVTIAPEAVSAVVTAGHGGEVFWLDSARCDWVTSPYYAAEVPEWIARSNRERYNLSYISGEWRTLLERGRYLNTRNYDIALAGKSKKDKDRSGSGRLKLRSDFERMLYTPAGNTAVLGLAKQAIAQYRLGEDKIPDLLNVCLDSPRRISEAYGPESIAGAEEADRFNPRQFEVIVNGFLNVRYGVGDWVVDYSDKCLWLNHNLIYERGLNLAEVQNEVAIFAMQFSGISHALAATAMRTSYFGSGYARRMQNSFYPRRSGDVILNLMPGWIEEQERCWSMSGSMYGYDTEVPLVFYGKGAGMQRVNRRVDMTAVAPTLARLAGIREPAASEGGVLEEIAE